MKKRIFVILLLIFSLLFASCPADSSDIESIRDEESHGQYGSAMEFVASMKIGWNLGNSLDAHSNGNPSETAWGNPKASRSLMNAVANYGFDAIRIPVTWGNKIGSAPDYKLNSSWLNRIDELVEYARLAGMKSIINIHHDGADSHYWLSVKEADITGEAKEAIDAKFSAVWKQIAERFSETGNYLIFEGFNELHDGSWGNGNTAQRDRINDLNQIFVDAVRSVGGYNDDRYLLIHGWVTRPSVTVSSLVMPEDPADDKIIVGFHFYDPYNFSGSARQNVWGEKALPGNWANEGNVERTFESVRKRFVDNGIPIIVGEYGAVNQEGDGALYRKYYMEYVTKVAADNKFLCFYWDNGGSGTGSEKFGLISRKAPYGPLPGASPIINVMMKAAKENYNLSDITPP